VYSALAEQRYDVLVLDISLKEDSGLDVLKEVKRTHPRLAVVMLTVYSEAQYALRAFRNGAAAYITKESAADELFEAVKKAATGGRFVTASIAERLTALFDRDADAPLHDGLSDREFEVLRLIGSGNTVSDIAERLHLSVKTVSTYRARLLRKMNMKSTVELMQYAVRTGLSD
jgi:DNA-binding NarL/FixJ family response regulator